jgi:hypothetical protein
MISSFLKSAAERLREIETEDIIVSASRIAQGARVLKDKIESLIDGDDNIAEPVAIPVTTGFATAPDEPVDGIFPLTAEGFVQAANLNIAAIFNSQKDAARWIIGTGNRKALGQVFEVATHRTAAGRFAVTGRAATPSA